MLDERRRGPRARIAGARVICEAASGGRLTGRVLDLGRGGLFVQADRRLTVGARLTIEIQIAGELAPWPALGRIIWVRETASQGKPAGAGVAFIDVDDAVLAAIDRILARSPHKSGRPPAAPERERTVLGIGHGTTAPVEAAPIVSVVPARERTVQGLAPAPLPDLKDLPPAREEQKTIDFGELELDADGLPVLPAQPLNSEPRLPEPPPAPPANAAPVPEAAPGPEKPLPPLAERSMAIDLVAMKAASAAPRAPLMGREDSLAQRAGIPKRRGGGSLVFLVLLASAGASGYIERDRLMPLFAPYLSSGAATAPSLTVTTAGAPSSAPAATASGPAAASGSAGAQQVVLPPAMAAARDAGSRAAPGAPSTASASSPTKAPASPAAQGVAAAPRRAPAPSVSTRPTPVAPVTPEPEPPTGDNPY
jgi:uncharacterized protein (TIGR02266 family)